MPDFIDQDLTQVFGFVYMSGYLVPVHSRAIFSAIDPVNGDLIAMHAGVGAQW